MFTSESSSDLVLEKWFLCVTSVGHLLVHSNANNHSYVIQNRFYRSIRQIRQNLQKRASQNSSLISKGASPHDGAQTLTIPSLLRHISQISPNQRFVVRQRSLYSTPKRAPLLSSVFAVELPLTPNSNELYIRISRYLI